jgi:hypothetical protein
MRSKIGPGSAVLAVLLVAAQVQAASPPRAPAAAADLTPTTGAPASPPATAQPTPAGGASGAPAAGAATGTPAQMEEARQRYRRALELYDEGSTESLESALLELERAYALAPSYRLLYNVGLVSMQLRQYARAYDAFAAYLQGGGAEIPPSRTEEVNGHLTRLGVRTGTLTITVDVPGAEVAVDDAVIGTSPLAKPVRVNAGRRRVSVTSAGRVAQRVVEIAGGDKSSVAFTLTGPAASAGGRDSTPKKAIPWVWWGATVVAGIGAGVAGAIALNASSQQSSQLNEVNPPSLESTHKTLVASSVGADAYGVVAIGLGATALYLTLSAPAKPDAPRVGLHVGPGSVSFELRAF